MIEIPKVIDEYNHWMGGITRNNQLISNYRHQLHCKQIWMSLMLHSLDVLSVNASLAHVGLQADMNNRLEQKEFILSLVEIMQERAIVMEYRRLRSAHEHTNTPSPEKSDRGSTPVSPICPLKGWNPLDTHIHTFSKTRSTCKYCSFLNLRSKQLHPKRAPPKVSNV